MSTRMARVIFVGLSFVAVGAGTRAASPPGDSTVDWLMNGGTTLPATQPVASTEPAGAFKQDEDGSREGTIALSDGTRIHGTITTTAEKPVRVWVEAIKDYQDIPFSMITALKAQVVWERDEQEWHFKASGSDVKEYSGKTYPVRETSYAITLTNGQTVEGAVVAPLYVTTDGKTKTYVLHKRDKGEVGQSLGQLVYVMAVSFP